MPDLQGVELFLGQLEKSDKRVQQALDNAFREKTVDDQMRLKAALGGLTQDADGQFRLDQNLANQKMQAALTHQRKSGELGIEQDVNRAAAVDPNLIKQDGKVAVDPNSDLGLKQKDSADSRKLFIEKTKITNAILGLEKQFQEETHLDRKAKIGVALGQAKTQLGLANEKLNFLNKTADARQKTIQAGADQAAANATMSGVKADTMANLGSMFDDVRAGFAEGATEEQQFKGRRAAWIMEAMGMNATRQSQIARGDIPTILDLDLRGKAAGVGIAEGQRKLTDQEVFFNPELMAQRLRQGDLTEEQAKTQIQSMKLELDKRVLELEEFKATGDLRKRGMEAGVGLQEQALGEAQATEDVRREGIEVGVEREKQALGEAQRTEAPRRQAIEVGVAREKQALDEARSTAELRKRNLELKLAADTATFSEFVEGKALRDAQKFFDLKRTKATTQMLLSQSKSMLKNQGTINIPEVSQNMEFLFGTSVEFDEGNNPTGIKDIPKFIATGRALLEGKSSGDKAVAAQLLDGMMSTLKQNERGFWEKALTNTLATFPPTSATGMTMKAKGVLSDAKLGADMAAFRNLINDALGTK